MRKALGARTALRIAACAFLAISLGLVGAAGQAPPAQTPSASPSAPASPSAGSPVFVTMPKNEAAAKRKPTPPPDSMVGAMNREMRAKNTPVGVAILTAVVALIFTVVVLVALRRRAKVCPRCFSLLYELGDPDDAGEDLSPDEPRDARPILACLGCGEVGMLRAGLFFRSGGQCPKCHKWNLASRFKVVQPSTYMMFGLIRIEEACSCGHASSFLRSTPPNQAPIPEFVGTSPFRA